MISRSKIFFKGEKEKIYTITDGNGKTQTGVYFARIMA